MHKFWCTFSKLYSADVIGQFNAKLARCSRDELCADGTLFRLELDANETKASGLADKPDTHPSAHVLPMRAIDGIVRFPAQRSSSFYAVHTSPPLPAAGEAKNVGQSRDFYRTEIGAGDGLISPSILEIRAGAWRPRFLKLHA